MSRLFSATFSLQNSYSVGDAIAVTFILENHSDQDYGILPWGTPLDGIKSPCLDVSFEGTPLDFSGLVHHHDTSRQHDALLQLKAKSTLEVSFDLTESYFIDKPGLYDILFTRCFSYMSWEKLTQGKSQTLNPLELTTFYIEPAKARFSSTTGGKPKPTQVMRLASEASTAQGFSCDLPITITGGNKAQQNALVSIWQQTHNTAKAAVETLENPVYGNLFVDMFTEKADLNLVGESYLLIFDTQNDLTFHLTLYPDIPGWAAAAIGAPYIVFFKDFLDHAGFTPFFSHTAITLHELSHAVLRAIDGPLAENSAYSYGYYAGMMSAQMPPGNYERLCADFIITLSAICLDRNGCPAPRSTLEYSASDLSTMHQIYNDDGVLKIEYGIPNNTHISALGRFVPSGSYQLTSSDINVKISLPGFPRASVTYDADQASLIRDITYDPITGRLVLITA